MDHVNFLAICEILYFSNYHLYIFLYVFSGLRSSWNLSNTVIYIR